MSEKHDSKRDAVLKGGRKSNKALAAGAAAAVVAAVFVAISFFSGGEGRFKAVSAEAGVVRIPVAEVSDGRAHYYSFSGSGRINFFVLRSSDGAIRAAFDACDVCFREKKGYRQEGDFMVCNNCGQKFPSAQINEVRGGCNPAPLERQIEGEYLVLKSPDIEQGRGYF